MKKIIRILIVLALLIGIFISSRLIGYNHMGNPTVNSYVEVSMSWPEASSEDIAEEIIRPMEKAFSSINDLMRIYGTAEDGIGRVVLVFKGGEQDNEIIQSINRQLTSIDGFPQTAGDPQITLLR